MNRSIHTEIKLFLETSPLYKAKKFKTQKPSQRDISITAIDMFCYTCERDRPFHDFTPSGGGAQGSGRHPMAKPEYVSSGSKSFKFDCVSCRKSSIKIDVHFRMEDEHVELQKHGQWPKHKIKRDKQLEKFFVADADNYEKATMCIVNGYGIAAFAYMRRIVESNIHLLLEGISAEVKATEESDEIQSLLNDLKDNSPMSKKIEIANRALPVYLKPNGLNPLGALYKVLSEGVHSFTDQECLERAKEVNSCLKYLVSELGTRKRNRESFPSMIGSI